MKPEPPKPDIHEEWRQTLLDAVFAARDEINQSQNAEELAVAVKILADIDALHY